MRQQTRAAAIVLVALLALVVGAFVIGRSTTAPTATAAPSTAAASASTSAATPSAASPSATASTAAWSRGIYLQTVDKAAGFTPANTRLILIARTSNQRVEVHNEIAWISTGPWSPDGTAVVAGDRVGQSYVIWPDLSLTKLEPGVSAWTWLDAGTLSGPLPQPNGGRDLVKVAARSGQLLSRDSIASGGAAPTVSPNGDWIAYSTSSPDAPGEAVTASKTQMVASGPRTHPAGWLPDGEFVFVRQAAVSTVEVRDPARADATVLGRFGDLVQALAQPSSAVVVVHDLHANQLSTLRGTVQRTVPLQFAYAQGNTFEGISRDGRTLAFSGGNSPVGTLTGTIDLETGAFTYMCDTGCWKLAVN